MSEERREYFRIDDEIALLDIGQQMLDRLGYYVITKTGSLEALELFQAKPDKFDLVITDMTKPNMTGDKLAQEMLFILPDIPMRDNRNSTSWRIPTRDVNGISIFPV